MSKVLNVGIVGFGLSGRVFHSPFIHVSEKYNLKTIVSSNDSALKKFPYVNVIRNYDELLKDNDIDIVILATPNKLHFEQAKKAFEAGKHVIIEKPITPTSEEVLELEKLALANNVTMFPYHNLRYNGDVKTIKTILNKDLLGDVLSYEAHFDRFVPELRKNHWRYEEELAGGTLYDLGVHLIDQAVNMFGVPEHVFCRLYTQRKGSVVDDSFNLQLIYVDKDVNLKASVFVREPGARYIIHGKKGSFVKHGIDPQEALLRDDVIPNSPDWGLQSEEDWGILNTEINDIHFKGKIETERGNYFDFFDNVHDVIVNGAEQAVTPEHAYWNIKIIEKAIESSNKKQVIKVK
jgi:predicted dehydrogenase